MHSFASRTSEAKTSSDTKASEVQMSEVQTSDMTIVEETSAEETADFLSLYPPRASLSSAMTELLCAHHKANPEAVSKMKRISREVWWCFLLSIFFFHEAKISIVKSELFCS